MSLDADIFVDDDIALDPPPQPAQAQPQQQVSGRVPPQNVDLEMCVLGAIMIDPQYAYPIARDHLTRQSFYLEGHGLIFDLMGELVEQGIQPDSIAVLDALRSRNLLPRVGGSGVVMGMLNCVPTAASIEYHSKLVADKAHQRALIKSCTRILDTIYRQELPADGLQNLAEETILALADQHARADLRDLKEIGAEFWDDLEHRYEQLEKMRGQGIKNPRLSGGLSTGFPDIDRHFTLKPGQLTIIAARPSQGKTSLAASMLQKITVEGGEPAAFFSLEMGNDELFTKMLSIGSFHIRDGRVHGIGTDRIESPGDLDEQDWAELARSFTALTAAPLYFDDKVGTLTPGQLLSKARELVTKRGVRLIVIDYLQLMTSDGNHGDNRVQEVSEISRALKQIARTLKVPIVAMSQLSRAVESRPGKRPRLADLRESGSIEQDADNVVFLWPEMPQPQGYAGMPLCGLLCEKVRSGPTGDEQLVFFKKITRFESSARKEQAEMNIRRVSNNAG